MTNKKDKSISPDGKWKVIFDTNLGVTWMQLTETQPQVKIKEQVKIEEWSVGYNKWKKNK